MNPSATRAALQRAWALLEEGDRPGARTAWEATCDQNLPDPESLQLFGAVALRLNEPSAARTRLQRAVKASPLDPQNHLLLGLALQRCGSLAPAERTFRAALRLRPGWADAAYNLARVLEDAGRPEAGLQILEAALEREPDDADLRNQQGLLLAALDRRDEAIDALRKAVACDPAHAPCAVNLGQELLRDGSAEGWGLLEARLQFAPNLAPPKTSAQPWNGEALDGRSILVWNEQGLGDTLQFVRYVPLLSAAGAEVHLRCQPALVTLLESMAGVTVCPSDAEPPVTDFHVPVASLPDRLSKFEGVPVSLTAGPTVEAPYVAAPPLSAENRRWLESLGSGRRVGLVWTGNPAHRENRVRSLPASALKRWMGIDGIRWVALQHGGGRRFRHPNLADPGEDRLGDLAQTAGWIQAMDLLITVDSMPVHLAGALGHPAWLLLCRPGDWRWGHSDGSNAWYPSIRSFRQERSGDWSSVRERVAEALRATTNETEGSRH